MRSLFSYRVDLTFNIPSLGISLPRLGQRDHALFVYLLYHVVVSQISINADIPPAPEAPKPEESAKAAPEDTHSKAEEVPEMEEDPESDLELDMEGVIGKNCTHFQFHDPFNIRLTRYLL